MCNNTASVVRLVCAQVNANVPACMCALPWSVPSAAPPLCGGQAQSALRNEGKTVNWCLFTEPFQQWRRGENPHEKAFLNVTDKAIHLWTTRYVSQLTVNDFSVLPPPFFFSFRQQRSFYGVNLSALHGAAVDEFFKQPIVVRVAKVHSLDLSKQ